MDEIWEHKKGKAWQLVATLSREKRGLLGEACALRWQVKILQARLRRAQAS